MARPQRAKDARPIEATPPRTPGASVASHGDDADASLSGGHRFTQLAALGLVAILGGALPFLVLMTLVQAEWAPLMRFDLGVAARLNDFFGDMPFTVTVLKYVTEIGGGATAGYILGISVVFMLVRRQYRIAAYLGLTALGLAVLSPVTKAYVDRVRPEVSLPLADIPSNASFPSGHAMSATVVWGALALVALSVVRPARRTALTVAAVSFILLTGFTRLALGVHFVTDVVAGWALGALWLAVTTAAFRTWLRYRHEPVEPVGLGERPALGLRLAPVKESILPRGRRSVALLVGAFVLTAAVITAAGLAAFGAAGENSLEAWDMRMTQSLLDVKTPALADAASAVGSLSGTWGIVAVVITGVTLSLAYRGSWRPAVFVLVAVAGELALYAITSQVVGRARPLDTAYTSGLPQAASFPSGHVAGAVVVYGALCAVAITYLRSRWRWTILVPFIAIVVAIMGARILLGAHHVLDTVGGLVLGSLWLVAVVRVLLAPSREPAPQSLDPDAPTDLRGATPA